MTLLPLTSIEVPPNRQRREFDPDSMRELVISLSETPYGLLHPLVVRQQDGKHVLVAGERRLRAIQDVYALGGRIRHAGVEVPPGQVPTVDLAALSPADAFEAELEENIRRRDLTMIEQAEATAKLFELRGLQAARAGKPAPSTADVAREVYDLPAAADLGGRQTTIRDQLIIAKHAADPDVRKATSIKEAVKIVKKKEEARQTLELSAAIGTTFTTAAHTLLNVDCLPWLAAAPEASFGLILSDPPYGMGADSFGDSGVGVSAAAHSYEDSYESWHLLMQVLPAALWRVAAASAHAYLFCDFDRFPELRERMSAAGWTVHRTPLIWHNPDGFRAPWPDSGPQRKYELILYAKKGDRKVTSVQGDVIECRKDTAVGHPAQKPVALLENLLRRSLRPGDRVLDPFAGSGSTVEAAHNLRLACTALERDPLHYGTAVKRLKALSAADPELF